MRCVSLVLYSSSSPTTRKAQGQWRSRWCSTFKERVGQAVRLHFFSRKQAGSLRLFSQTLTADGRALWSLSSSRQGESGRRGFSPDTPGERGSHGRDGGHGTHGSDAGTINATLAVNEGERSEDKDKDRDKDKDKDRDRDRPSFSLSLTLSRSLQQGRALQRLGVPAWRGSAQRVAQPASRRFDDLHLRQGPWWRWRRWRARWERRLGCRWKPGIRRHTIHAGF